MSRGTGHWFIDDISYRNWASEKVRELGPSFPLERPSVRNLILLALLERKGEELSYEDLNSIFRRRGLLKAHGRKVGAIPTTTLRVGVAELSRTLKRNAHYYQVHARRERKKAMFELKYSEDPSARSLSVSSTRAPSLPIDPREICAELVRPDGRLSFASLFSCHRAAAMWLSLTSQRAPELTRYDDILRHSYEARAYVEYGLHEHLSSARTPRLGVVSLGTGEGLGELQLLKEILGANADRREFQVQYVVVDTSEILLTSHCSLVREVLREEIQAGRLIVAPCLGDFFNLRRALVEVRARHGEGFAIGCPVLFTLFGNCLGNYEARESEFFDSVAGAFDPAQAIAGLIGISLVPEEERTERPRIRQGGLYSFFMETPRHLMYALDLMDSLDENGETIAKEESREFLSGADDGAEWVTSQPYVTPSEIVGDVFRFYYTLRNDIATRDRKQLAKSGSRLLLYSIARYELASLLQFVRRRGFEAHGPSAAFSELRWRDEYRHIRYGVLGLKNMKGWR